MYPGSAAAPQSSYVELQMYSGGQNFVSGHAVKLFNAAGGVIGTFSFGADLPGSSVNQQTMLIGDDGVQAAFGVTPDLVNAGFNVPASGGAACWAESLDCVSRGSFSGSLPSPSGSSADPLGIPDGMALRRTIAPRCQTLLEEADDSSNSAADFSDAFPAPRPNSATPDEHVCSTQAPAGSASPEGGPAAGRKRPETRIRQRLARRIHDRTPTFRFTSSVSGSTYLCKLDKRSFRRCRSPFTSAGSASAATSSRSRRVPRAVQPTPPQPSARSRW